MQLSEVLLDVLQGIVEDKEANGEDATDWLQMWERSQENQTTEDDIRRLEAELEAR